MRLNPHYPGWYATVRAGGNYMIRHDDEAVRVLLRQEGHNFYDLRILAASYGPLGQREAARAQVEKILAINPQFSTETLRPRLPHKHEADIAHYLEGLRRAGLK